MAPAAHNLAGAASNRGRGFDPRIEPEHNERMNPGHEDE